MLKLLKSALLLSSFTLISACSSLTKAREQNITMANKAHTPAELIEVLGEPQSRVRNGDVEIWYYDIYSANNSRTYPYTARVRGDKLLEFYSDPSPRTSTRAEALQVHADERRPSSVED